MNFRLVLRIVGILLLLEAVSMVACGVFARLDVVAGDAVAMVALFQAAGITGGAGAAMIAAGGFQKIAGRIPRRQAGRSPTSACLTCFLAERTCMSVGAGHLSRVAARPSVEL